MADSLSFQEWCHRMQSWRHSHGGVLPKRGRQNDEEAKLARWLSIATARRQRSLGSSPSKQQLSQAEVALLDSAVGNDADGASDALLRQTSVHSESQVVTQDSVSISLHLSQPAAKTRKQTRHSGCDSQSAARPQTLLAPGSPVPAGLWRQPVQVGRRGRTRRLVTRLGRVRGRCHKGG